MLVTLRKKWSRGHPSPRWPNYISDLAWSSRGVEPVEISEIAENRISCFGYLVRIYYRIS